MQFAVLSTLALLAATAVSEPAPTSTPAPSITITLFNDLECKDEPGQSVTLVEGGCGLSTGEFQSFLIPPTINPAFDDEVGKGCGFIIFDDAGLNCTGAPENVIAPDLGLGKCVPSLLFGNFAGPFPAQAITLQCNSEI
ncbi:hypothetical protein N431DRAFT_462351 [Stipitochalara longipes BDJ]|nr:hypothetical protein N431DRAFT_462351 [Stipitochalara longipes BDJ]